MKKFTKILSLILCLVMTLTMFLACSSNKDNAKNNAAGDDNKAQALEGDFYDENGLYYMALDTTEKTCEVSVGRAKSLKEIVIPATYNGFTVTGIAQAGFADCENLESVTIPDSVVAIGDLAFQNCTKLATVKLSDKAALKKIGNAAFKNTAIYNNANNWQDGVFYFGKYLIEAEDSITACTVKEGTKVIAAYAFYNCQSMTSITLPKSLSYIDTFAFNNCKALKKVYITDLKAWCSLEFANYLVNPLGLNTSSELYLNGTLVTHLVLTSDITSVSDYAFYGYRKMTDLTISSSMKTIGEKAFEGVTLNANVSEGSYHIFFKGTEKQWKAVSKASAGLPGNDHISFEE